MAYNVKTEWDDIHVKLGNYEPHEKEITQAEMTKDLINKLENYKEKKNDLNSKKEEDEDEEELDSDFDSDDDEFMKEYNRKIKEKMDMVHKKEEGTFGYVKNINKADYVKEVNEEKENVWILIHLYQDFSEICNVINNYLNDLSMKYKKIKFLKAVATKTVENFPDNNVPTIIFYNSGNLINTFIRPDKMYKKFTKRCIEDLMVKVGALYRKVDEDKNEILKILDYIKPKKRNKEDFESDEEDKDDKQFISNKMMIKY